MPTIKVVAALANLLQVSGEDSHEARGATPWARQAQLPLRMGGMGLRCARRVSQAVYWSSWADCLQPLAQRFPDVGDRFLAALNSTDEG